MPQQLYQQKINAQPGALREGRILSPPQAEGAGSGILQAALALGGEGLNILAKDYARQMRGRIDDSILKTNAEFEQWKEEYKRTRQGADALTAQQDFANKYMELAEKAIGEFNAPGNEIYGAELRREYVKNGFYALKDGGAWQRQQDEAWQKSQWEAQVSAFQKMVDANPHDADMLNMEAQTLLQSWMTKNPGKDAGAVRDQIQSTLANGRMQAMLASKDYAGAKTLLGGGFAAGQPAQSGSQRGRLADISGMDNEVVSLIREIAPKYGVDPELMLAVSKAESGGKVKAATSSAGAVGPMQLIPKWAKKAGFDPYDLRQNIEGGISEFSQLMKKYGNEEEALIAYNWGLGNWDAYKKTGKGYYGQERPKESLQYVNAVYRHTTGGAASGAGTGAPGFTAAERMRYQHQIEAQEKAFKEEQQTAFIAGEAQRIAGEIGQLPMEKRKYVLNLELQKLDPAIRSTVAKICETDIAAAEDAQKARDGAQAYMMAEEGKKNGDSPSQYQARINKATWMSENGKKLAEEIYLGKLEDNELTRTALNNLLVQIDMAARKGTPLQENDIYKFAYDNRLTEGQKKTAIDYLAGGGNLYGLKISDVRRTWALLQAGIGEEVKESEMPVEIFQAALQEFKDGKYAGKKPDDKTLRQLVASLLIEGTVPGWLGRSSMTWGEALIEGKQGEWQPGEKSKFRGGVNGPVY